MPLTEFTPFASLLGGAMIGLSAVLLMASVGRIAGISGIAARLLLPPYLGSDVAGRLAFVLGLVAAPGTLFLIAGRWPEVNLDAGAATLVSSGLLVGFGAVWGAGCTSGHGVCGLARLSPRSFVAVAVFMTTAIATVYLVRHIL